MSSFKRLIFLRKIGDDNKDNFILCDLKCKNCPIKFVCFSTKGIGYDILYTDEEWYVNSYYACNEDGNIQKYEV